LNLEGNFLTGPSFPGWRNLGDWTGRIIARDPNYESVMVNPEAWLYFICNRLKNTEAQHRGSCCL